MCSGCRTTVRLCISREIDSSLTQRGSRRHTTVAHKSLVYSRNVCPIRIVRFLDSSPSKTSTSNCHHHRQPRSACRPLRQCFLSRHEHSLTTIMMRPAVQAGTAAVRTWTRHALPNSMATSRLLTASIPESQKRLATSSTSQTSSFASPFETASSRSPDTNRIPNFGPYMSKSSETTNRVFQYFVVGTMGLLTAAGAKATVQGKRHQERRACKERMRSGGDFSSAQITDMLHVQTSWSTCQHRQMYWPWPRSRSTSLPSQRARM